jgi:transketolase
LRANVMKPVYKHAPFEIGKAEVISKGSDVTILVYGMLFAQALRAKELLENTGLSVGLLNMRSLKPVDEAAILEAASTSKLLVTLEDHFQTGGLNTIVAEVLMANEKTAKVLPISLNERWFKPALLNEVLEFEGFTGEQIAEKILAKLGVKNTAQFNKVEIENPEFAE